MYLQARKLNGRKEELKPRTAPKDGDNKKKKDEDAKASRRAQKITSGDFL